MDKLRELQRELRASVSAEKALALQRFFKTGPGQYGAGDLFLGVMVPETRKLVSRYYKQFMPTEAWELVRSKYHEERLLGLLIWVKQFEHGDESEQTKIYELYLANTKFINNWDLVDLTAPRIVGAYLWGRDKSVLTRLVNSDLLWDRRVAVLATAYFLYKSDDTETYRLAKVLLGDKHDLIHKAVGWMLREAGKRCSEQKLEEFLQEYATRMPRTMLRYAIERLPLAKRRYYMGLK